jgi:hypothetical protein
MLDVRCEPPQHVLRSVFNYIMRSERIREWCQVVVTFLRAIILLDACNLAVDVASKEQQGLSHSSIKH